MAKKNYTWKLESDVIDKIQLLAEKEHRSLTNYIEWMFMSKVRGEKLTVAIRNERVRKHVLIYRYKHCKQLPLSNNR